MAELKLKRQAHEVICEKIEDLLSRIKKTRGGSEGTGNSFPVMWGKIELLCGLMREIIIPREAQHLIAERLLRFIANHHSVANDVVAEMLADLEK